MTTSTSDDDGGVVDVFKVFDDDKVVGEGEAVRDRFSVPPPSEPFIRFDLFVAGVVVELGPFDSLDEDLLDWVLLVSREEVDEVEGDSGRLCCRIVEAADAREEDLDLVVGEEEEEMPSDS